MSIDWDNVYDRDITTWTSYDGRETLVKDLDVRHLVNILNHIIEANGKCKDVNAYPSHLNEFLTGEARYRIMTGFAANIGIPKQLDDGTWTVVNQTPEEKRIEDELTAMHKAALEQQQIELRERKEQTINDILAQARIDLPKKK